MPEEKTDRKKLTQSDLYELDVQIGFMEGVIKRDPGYVEALQILGDDYTRRGKFVEGLRIDEQLSQLRPDDQLVQYNLACSCSLTADYSRAAAALSKALDLGYRDFKWLAEDPDLAGLRNHSLFRGIRAKMRALKSTAE
jgi:hypothetical protein